MALFATPVAVLIGYGIARSGASAFNGIYEWNDWYACFVYLLKLGLPIGMDLEVIIILNISA
jgi:hypothetical protein